MLLLVSLYRVKDFGGDKRFCGLPGGAVVAQCHSTLLSLSLSLCPVVTVQLGAVRLGALPISCLPYREEPGAEPS